MRKDPSLLSQDTTNQQVLPCFCLHADSQASRAPSKSPEEEEMGQQQGRATQPPPCTGAPGDGGLGGSGSPHLVNQSHEKKHPHLTIRKERNKSRIPDRVRGQNLQRVIQILINSITLKNTGVFQVVDITWQSFLQQSLLYQHTLPDQAL